MLDLVVFRLDGQMYGLALLAVERVVPIAAFRALPEAPPVVLGVIDVHGEIVPVIDFRRRLGLPQRSLDPSAHLLLARTTRRRLAAPVDEVLGIRAIADDAVVRPATLVPGAEPIAGIIALPDGLLYIHDVETFLSLDEERRLAEALGGAGT